MSSKRNKGNKQRHKGGGQNKRSNSGNCPRDHQNGIDTLKIPNPLPVQIQPTAEDNQRYAEEKDNRNRHTSLASNLNWITAIAAGITFFGIIASLLVATYNIRSSKKTLETDQRAWVNVSSVEVLVPISTTEKSWFLVKLANTGKTPALREHLICAGALINGDPTCRPQPGLVYFGPVAPGGVPVGTTIWIDPQKQAAVEAMTKPNNRLHLKFTLEYDDIFGKTHHTTYCGFYPPVAPVPQPTVLSGCDNAGSMD